MRKRFTSFFKKSHLPFTLLGIIFLLWMLFLDTNSFLIHRELDQEIKELEAQKKEFLN